MSIWLVANVASGSRRESCYLLVVADADLMLSDLLYSVPWQPLPRPLVQSMLARLEGVPAQRPSQTCHIYVYSAAYNAPMAAPSSPRIQ